MMRDILIIKLLPIFHNSLEIYLKRRHKKLRKSEILLKLAKLNPKD